MSTTPSEGWYPDPAGQPYDRYWDGAAWTDQVRDGSGTHDVLMAREAGPAVGTATAKTSSGSSKPVPTWAIVLASVVGVLLVIGAIVGDSDTSDEKNASSTIRTATQAGAPPATTSTATSAAVATSKAASELEPEPTPEPNPATKPKPPSVKSQIEQAARGVEMGDGTTAVRVHGTSGTREVTVDYDVADNFSRGMRRGGAERDLVELYKAIFTSDVRNKVGMVTARGFFPLVDQYGKDSRGKVFETVLLGDEAKKINWDNTGAVDWNNVWLITFKHPDF